ncbi:Multi antimicrobial extrusion protein [Dillenia turbinata]|uniref:Multi antimicrobial extrusion protein n=1 Tax=Dillenia turbinata TaxID=194707 RepID=A0AAN8VDN4_9MAGN
MWLAGPLIAVSILQYCLQVISIMFVGHLGELPLSGASLATSIASVTGFSVLTQNIVFPMMVISGITVSVHIVSVGLSYIKLSPRSKTWTGLSKDALCDIFSFLKLTVPSAIMICLEYWSFEMVVLLSGLLLNPELETSVLSVSLDTCWMVYMISVGLGGAIRFAKAELKNSLENTSPNSLFSYVFLKLISYVLNPEVVSNELGARQPQGACLAVGVVIMVAISEGAVIGTKTILVRGVWGKLFRAARGCGWKNICSCINLVAFYIVTILSAVLFAFVLHIGGMGEEQLTELKRQANYLTWHHRFSSQSISMYTEQSFKDTLIRTVICEN